MSDYKRSIKWLEDLRADSNDVDFRQKIDDVLDDFQTLVDQDTTDDDLKERIIELEDVISSAVNTLGSV